MAAFYKYQSDFRYNRSTDLFIISQWKNLEMFWQQSVYWRNSDWPAKSIWYDKPQNLLDKLLRIGFSKNAISWYESYLAERHFTLEVANRVSKFANISCGIPQGSVLGPLLFFMYANDMSQAVKFDLYLYANDSCLLFQQKNVTEMQKQSTQKTSAISVIGL